MRMAQISYVFNYLVMEMNEQKTGSLLRKKTIKGFKNKFQELYKDSIDESISAPHDILQNSTKQFKKLAKKISNGEELKAVSRGFHRSLYKKLENRIVEKPLSFYIYGLKEREKRSCKKVFNQIFDVPRRKLGGTLSVTDLWTNSTSIRYLKENQMFCNKEVILKEFKQLGKDAELKRKQQKQLQQKEEIQIYKQLLQQKKKSKTNHMSLHELNSRQTCSNIKQQLSKLSQHNKYRRGASYSRNMLKNLEQNMEQWNVLQKKYKKQMFILL